MTKTITITLRIIITKSSTTTTTTLMTIITTLDDYERTGERQTRREYRKSTTNTKPRPVVENEKMRALTMTTTIITVTTTRKHVTTTKTITTTGITTTLTKE